MNQQPLEPILVYSKPDEEPPEDRVWGEFDIYAFDKKGGFPSRATQIASLLKKIVDNSDMGKKLGIDDRLASELKRVLASACYLFNCESFRRGEYFDFDRFEIDRKLGRRL